MAKRKTKVLPPRGALAARGRQEPKLHLDTLEYPNHQFAVRADLSRAERFLENGQLWGLFVAESHYQPGGWWREDAPSWFDARIFGRMLREDATCQSLAFDIVRRQPQTLAELQKLLGPLAAEVERVFEAVYLPWLFRQLDPERLRLCARWLVAVVADEQLEPLPPATKKKPKRNQPHGH